MTNEQVPGEMPRKSFGRKLLIVIVSVLGAFALLGAVGWYIFLRPGKPIPPVNFADSQTSGMVVFHADPKDPGFRSLLRYLAASAIEHDLVKDPDGRKLLELIKTEQVPGEIPVVSVIGSYKGDSPENVKSFAAVSMAEFARLRRIQLGIVFNHLAGQAPAEKAYGARIVSLNEMMRQVEGSGKAGTELSEADRMPGPAESPFVRQAWVSVAERCIFLGRSAEDVKAGIVALQTSQIDENSPFMTLFRRVDTSQMLFGALVNSGGLFLSAIFPPDQVEDARSSISGVVGFDPRQLKGIAFSVRAISDDEADLKLWVDAADPQVAQQIQAMVQSLQEASTRTTGEFPLRIQASDAKVQGSSYSSTIHVSGVRGLIDDQFARLKQRLDSLEPLAPSQEPPPPGRLDPPQAEAPRQ